MIRHPGEVVHGGKDDKARTRAADGGGDAGMTSGERDELKRLRRENARLKEDNEILRKAAARNDGLLRAA